MKKQITIEDAKRVLLLKTTEDVVMGAVAELYRHTACSVMDEYEIVRPDGSICSVEDERQWYLDKSILTDFFKRVSFITEPKEGRG